MKMNNIEKFVMTSPIRSWFLRHVEAPILLRLSNGLHGLNVLEIGCGNGVGTELIFSMFGAKRVTAIDIDADMVDRARRRLRQRYSGQLTLAVGDATAIDADKDSFDAVVDFAAVHHVPEWQKALTEIVRVLKPGGVFVFEEVTAQWITRWPYKSLYLHPKNRFAAPDFLRELEAHHLAIGQNYVEKKGGDFIFGVAAKAAG